MLLRSAHNSPFGRKVRVVAAVLGLSDRLDLAECSFTDPADPLRIENPLGKMPVLTTDDGLTLFDSAVIVDYFNALADGGVIAQSGPDRWRDLREQALGDGILDAGVSIQLEKNLRPADKIHPEWIAFQQDKMLRGLDAFAAAPPPPDGNRIGTLVLACALDWIDFRQPVDWRDRFPALVDWLAAFHHAHPELAATAPK